MNSVRKDKGEQVGLTVGLLDTFHCEDLGEVVEFEVGSVESCLAGVD
jgi:hypothetical protein